MRVMIGKILSLMLFSLLFFTCQKHSVYNEFIKRLQEEEPYIGFFATEKKCISDVNERYLKERRKFFFQIMRCKEDPEKFIEPFIEFCKSNHLLKENCENEWEKVLTILSYEMYANKPIFEYSTDRAIEHRNLVFAQYPNKKLKLDLFLPKHPIDKPVPCIICIHGGGWHVNRRIWFEPFAKYLAANGFAAVTIDYRKLPAVKIIDCVHDCKAAVRWVRANAGKYGIDANRIGALGASAGAHLVALLATTPNLPELEGNGGNPGISSEIQAAVGIATPVFNLEKNDWIRKEMGISADELKLISPYEHVSAQSAPILLIHGTSDKTVDPQNSQDLYDKYKAYGVYAELKWIPDEDHGFYEGNDRAIKLATRFFKKQFIH